MARAALLTRGAPTTYTLRLVDPSGMPVKGAKITLQGRMADGMTVLTPLRPGHEPGMYRGQVLFTYGREMGTDAASERAGQAVRAAADHRRKSVAAAWLVAGALLGVLLLALLGWVAWVQGALVGLRWVDFDSPLTLAAFGFLAGLGAFFAPCAFSLFPGYVSYYLATATGSPEHERLGRSLLLGLTCAGGSTAFFALVGAAITIIGGAVSPYLIATKPFIALAVVALGVVLLADLRLPALPLALRTNPAGRTSPAAAIFLYGFGYALASTGCTLPIYVSVTVLPLTSGYSGAAFLTFLSFALAMALMMLLTTALVGLAKRSLIYRLQASTAWIKRASGVVLILSGLYLGYYYVAAGM